MNNNDKILNEKKFNLQPEIVVYTSQLEADFEHWRIFGDERDLTFADNCIGQSKIKCVINKISGRLRSDLYMDLTNAILICANCVKSAIKNFKKWREKKFQNSDSIEMFTPEESEKIREKTLKKLSSLKFKFGDIVEFRTNQIYDVRSLRV